MRYEPSDVVTDEQAFRDLYRAPFPAQIGKILDHVDPLCAAWIDRSPFVAIATVDSKGAVDVSPKGDPAGFVKVLDPGSLAIPDRPGNHRFDGFANILQTGRIGLMFLVPNRNEVLRVNGSALIVRDAPLRESMAVNGRVPDFAILVRVEEAFFHCGKAMIRSGLWRPQDAAPADGLPTYGEALKAHAALSESLEALETHLRRNEEERLYDE